MVEQPIVQKTLELKSADFTQMPEQVVEHFAVQAPVQAAVQVAVPAPYDPLRPLAGKVALITGAGRGIGKGIAQELGKRGATVVVNYGSSSKAAEQVVDELVTFGSTDSVSMQADVSKPAEVARLFERTMERFGHIDIVVSNSGTEVWCPEVDVTPELFDHVFNLNCRGQFFVAQQALKYCSPGGRIILTSSVAATLSGIPNHALYAGSKAAVEGFTRAFAVDCGHKGITVNAIAPGGVKTDMYDENSWHYVPGGYKGMPMSIIDDGLAKLCPLGRVGVPTDIGKAVFALCSTEGEWINGQVIKLTGGSAT
jgi:3-oxoacyl-[acyl-carrier protein] reductase